MNTKTYNTLKKIFPIAFKFSSSVGQLVAGLLIHLLAFPLVSAIAIMVVSLVLGTVSTVIAGILGFTIILAPLAVLSGLLFGAIIFVVDFALGVVLGNYGWIAAVFEILVFAKVIKEPEADESVVENAEPVAAEAIETETVEAE